MKIEFKESYKYWRKYTHGKLMAFLDGLLIYAMKLNDYIQNKLLKPVEKK